MTIRFVCPDCGAKFHDSLSWEGHREGHLWADLYSEDDRPESPIDPSGNPYAEPAEHAADCHYEDEPCSDWCAWEGGRFPEQWQGGAA